MEQNNEKAVEYYELAADNGNAKAQSNLGICYENGNGVEQDYEKAVEYYQLAADQGYPGAQLNLGACYDEGLGVEQDYEKAVKYYQLAADQEMAEAQYNLGNCYLNGLGVDQDYEKAVEYYQLAADQGFAAAQYNLGLCYYNGFGVEQDYEKAVEYYQLAAEQGDAEAQFNLGYMYYNGEGVEQDYEEAVRYYRLAADQGDAYAQYNLGLCYYSGEGVEQDYEEAMKYFTLAVEQEIPNAMFMLGICYQDGTGVEKDLEKAAELYEKALDAGYEPDEEDEARLKEVLGEDYQSQSEYVDIKDRKLTEDELAIAIHVIENFLKLAAVPRPSHHEEKVSAFLMEWAKEQGFDPVQDDVLNVIFDVPASEGYEEYPMVGLQAHMDMVCVGDSPDYEPENDPIKVIVDYDAATMTADGTSLGADDGIGCAIIMSLAQDLAPHGPLRIIITVDEEDGMTGIMNLDASTVTDLDYLINVDSESSDAVTVSTAGGVQMDVTEDEVPVKNPDGNCAMEISIAGLKGGHSGTDINKGRVNAIYALEGVLKELNIPYEIASFEGGTASNAIPVEAMAVITINQEDQDKVIQAVKEAEASLKEEYQNTEEDLSVKVDVYDVMPEEVVESDFSQTVFNFMDGIVNGVYSMSKDIDGLVESSSNLGILTLTPEKFWASAYVRSSSRDEAMEILSTDQNTVEENDLTVTMEPSGDPWPYNPDSVLLPITQEVYLEQNGKEINVEALHATLECGTFAVMNPDLDMVSIGPDLIDVHSTNEMIYLRTIPKTFNLLAGILDEIGKAE